ncbi:peptide chain release factor N(5)-glutamine methyltransferase [Oxalobacter sp. OttesenSCG-928-P03]|nr:peptide chain release factor N(5)-glutamine methyltransferase [Oxalobacter sp. OttesenSCG-928-P03]
MTSPLPQHAPDAGASFTGIKPGTSIAALFHRSPVDPVDLRILLEHALGLSHVQLITRSERLLDEEEAKSVSRLIARRLKGEPVAHLVGVREFYGLPFRVTPDVLIPRPETELLVELAAGYLPAGGKMLDMGTGTGAIAVAVAHERPDVEVMATDISAAALEIAGQNAGRNLGKEGRIRFCQGDWFAALPSPARFDLIVSNPPYIAQTDPHLSQGDLRYEPAHALTDFDDGLSAFRVLAGEAAKWLNPGGRLLVEHGYDQAEAVCRLLLENGFVSVESWNDLAGIRRVSGGIFPGAPPQPAG